MSLFKKPTEAERGELPLNRRGHKEGKALVKGVRKFLRYNDDLISEDHGETIREKKDAFQAALKDRSSKRKDLEGMAEDLTATCKKSVKDYKPSAWKENIEVVFVAVVIAMGIRAYFIQQFKIPTGSMQPTLNGIIAYPTEEMNPGSDYQAPEDYERPGLARRTWQKIWYGRSHVKWVAEEDDVLLLDERHFYHEKHFVFFTRTYLGTRKGHVYSAPGTKTRIYNLLDRELMRRAVSSNPGGSLGEIPVRKGETIAEGYVETGDQLVVNKFVYHWKRPERGEVFVFNTRGIDGIQRTIDPRQGSQHYIKRIGGVPGDHLRIDPPRLLVNGEVAAEPGLRRVMSQEGLYPGYEARGRTVVDLPQGRYWALGDNSASSRDSRNWGTVPEGNIVGRGAFVYYPFGNHFGPVD